MNEVEQLRTAIREGEQEEIHAALEALDARDAVRAVCDLPDAEQSAMLATLEPYEAAELLDDLPPVEAVEAISLLPPEAAAAIVHELPSDEQADLVAALDGDGAAALLAEMDPVEAERITTLASYGPETAGGLMATEVVALRGTTTVGRVLDRFRRDADRFRKLDVQYAYVTEKPRRLIGVLRLRDLLLAAAETPIEELMVKAPLSVEAGTGIAELRDLFEEHPFLGVPVVDAEGALLGVVSRQAVDEAGQDRAESDFRRSLGLVEEEVRSLPVLRRSRLRLAWLSINIVLNVVAASVIAGYQETLQQVIALAVFLPIISDMSGCSGNQAVAVSMRELSLGVLRPGELARVWLKEASVGLLNGAALGGLLGGVAWAYYGNPWLGLVVGVALGLNTLVAVLMGGALPLLLKRWGVDPALASGPILTTVTDMFGFFLVLSLATLALPRLLAG